MSTDDTAASEHGADAETTQVPPLPADEPELAWSVDDDTDEMPTKRHARLIWAGLSVLVVAVAAALVLLLSTLFGRHTTNTARPQPVPSSPVPTTLAAAPPPPVTAQPPAPAPSAASASPYATLVGKWEGHERVLTVSGDGTIEMKIPDVQACPTCSMASTPSATIHIGLTSYNATPDGTPDGSGKFFGYVKDSSDTRAVPVAVPVEVDLTNASDYSYRGSPPDHTASGRVVTVSINPDNVGSRDEGPFCDDAAAHSLVCGA